MSATYEYQPGVVASIDPIVGSPSRRAITVDGRLAGYVALVGGYDNGTKCWAATDQDGYRLEGPNYLFQAVAQVAANARGEFDDDPKARHPMSTDHTPGEATVTLPVSMLRRWADTLEGGSRFDTDPGFETAVVAEAIRAVLADTLDSSPDPEGAVAREVAPESDTAAAAEPSLGEAPWGAGSDWPARIRVGDGPFYTGVRRADDPVDSGVGAMTDERLADVLDGLHAYDMGATDSGIKDEELRGAALAELAMRPSGFVDWVIHRLYLTPEAQASGYSEEDADDFREWLGDQIVLAPDSDTARAAPWRPEPGVAPPGYHFAWIPFEDGRGGVWTLALDSDTARETE